MTSQEAADRLLARLRRGPEHPDALVPAVSTSRAELAGARSELEARGYRLTADGEGRLQLAAVPDLLLADEIEAATASLAFGHPVHTFGRIGSTNGVAARLAAAGAPEGTLVTAEEQLQGRGRQGHDWHSPPGVGVWMSLILRPPLPPAEAAGLPLLGGLAVTAALRAGAGVDARIKWPNDVLVDGRKVCGVLCESAIEGPAVRYAVMGIGLNVNQSDDDWPPELSPIACSLRGVTGQRHERVALLARVLEELETRYRSYCSGQSEVLAAEFRRHSDLVGRTVRVTENGQLLEGTVVDISPAGALLLQTAGALRQITVGNASLRMD